jgi:hypothetical protein
MAEEDQWFLKRSVGPICSYLERQCPQLQDSCPNLKPDDSNGVGGRASARNEDHSTERVTLARKEVGRLPLS